MANGILAVSQLEILSQSGTGIVTIVPPATNTNRTLTLPDSTGTLLNNASSIARAQLPAGSVLQVVSTTTSSNVSSSSGSDVDTGLTASITPTSSASKIFVLVSSMLRASAGSSGNCYVYQKVWRGAIGSGTMIHDGYPIIGAQNTDARGVGAVMLVDSPATTASVTYRVSINSGYASSVNINATTSPSTITLMEIAV